MSDLLDRARKAMSYVSNLSLPPWERLQEGLESFSGLQITGIAKEVWEPFETTLAAVNGLFDDYDLTPNDDLRQVDEDDIRQGLEILTTAASRAIEAELDRIVAELDNAGRNLPIRAICEAREHRDLMIPRLIRVLREAMAKVRKHRAPKGDAHFFAVFLLSEFKAAEAFPAILEAFSLPDELTSDLFSDAVTSIVSPVLAQFAGETPEVLDSLIGDRRVYEYVRWEAASAYIYLIRDKRLSRDEVVRRLRQHLRQALDQDDAAIVSGLVCVLTDLAASEAIDDITEAFDRELADTFLIRKEDVDESIAKGDERVRQALTRCRPTGFPDTIEELQQWASFQPEPVKPAAPPPRVVPIPPPLPMPRVNAPVTELDLSNLPRIGRNDPCRCGSGKKFKKCCGSRV